MEYLLTHAIERAAARRPERVAVRCDGRELTYAELCERSRSLAAFLHKRQIGCGDKVGILQRKSVESVIALYGIMMAGAAYVPIDPGAPPERVAALLRECAMRCLISSSCQRPLLQALRQRGVRIDWLIGECGVEDLGGSCVAWPDVYACGPLQSCAAIDEDAAYVLYTSGSTGAPKGIVHTHRSALAFAQWARAKFRLTADDILGNHAPLHFDLSTFDFFAGALAGATTAIVTEDVAKLPASLASFIEQERLSIWYSVPLALTRLVRTGQLEQRNLGSLREVLFAGEAFPPKHLRAAMQALPRARFTNLYGPTETNVCTCQHVPRDAALSDEPLPIGVPCDNVATLVIDEQDRPVASQEIGELLIRGAVVMRGYLGRPELNERAFYRRQGEDFSIERFYRTGDLVRRNAVGAYVLVGRKDRQVKARGFRVELDEVEAAILCHAGVEEAVALAVADADSSQTIVAIVVTRAGCSSGGLREHLQARLPWFAVPSRVLFMDDLPRTATGKVDRRALARTHSAAAGGPSDAVANG